MITKKLQHLTSIAMTAAILLGITPNASAILLKQGMQNNNVKTVQTQLKKTGYYNGPITGYFGPATASSVKKFQQAKKIKSDGIIGTNTYKFLFGAVSTSNTVKTSRSAQGTSLAWDQAKNVFSVGSIATITDVNTKKTFKIKRTYGTNHADVEPLTKTDAATIRSIWGGWSWDRRAVIVKVNGRNIAASMTAMPHAGVESAKANAWVKGRSGGYGYGVNLDAVKGNGVSGHMDIHFLNSRTHSSNHVDAKHQQMIRKAAQYL